MSFTRNSQFDRFASLNCGRFHVELNRRLAFPWSQSHSRCKVPRAWSRASPRHHHRFIRQARRLSRS